MPTTATAQNTGVVETAITFIQDGGFFMYPILVVLALGLALSLERIIYLQATKAKNQKTWKDVYPLIAKGLFVNGLICAPPFLHMRARGPLGQQGNVCRRYGPKRVFAGWCHARNLAYPIALGACKIAP